jgi:hypothetical protein
MSNHPWFSTTTSNINYRNPTSTVYTLGAKIDAYENHMRQTHMVRICADCGTKVPIQSLQLHNISMLTFSVVDPLS